MQPLQKIYDMTGVILAGGASRRMGSDKALLPFQGLRLVDHVHRVLKTVFGEVLLVTNRTQNYADVDCRKVVDSYPGAGALAGIHSALVHAGQDRIFVAACDLPFISQTVIQRICAFSHLGDVVLPYTCGGHEPLHAVYSKACLPVIEGLLERDQRRVGALFEQVKVVRIGANELGSSDLWERSFCNINTPEDYFTLRDSSRQQGMQGRSFVRAGLKTMSKRCRQSG